MKSLSKILVIIAVFFITSLAKPVHASAQGGDVNFQVFYDNLSPYGQWVQDPTYGYIWIPANVGPEFAPYGSHGYWAWTDYGWTWVSSFAWGWAPFHYGRWDYESTYGWYWIPDYQWGPAWVEWSQEPGYYGWAPLGPGIGIDVAIGGGYHPSMKRWLFMDERHMGDQHIHKYYIPRADNGIHISRATILRNTYDDQARHGRYISGPSRDEVQKFRGSPVTRFEITDRAQPGHEVSGNQINIYRPRVDVNTRNVARPPKIETRQTITPVQQRNTDYRATHPVRPTDRPQSQQRPQQQQQPRQQPQQQQRPQPQQQPRQQPQQQRPQPQQQPRQQPQQQRQMPQQQPRQMQQQQRAPEQRPGHR